MSSWWQKIKVVFDTGIPENEKYKTFKYLILILFEPDRNIRLVKRNVDKENSDYIVMSEVIKGKPLESFAKIKTICYYHDIDYWTVYKNSNNNSISLYIAYLYWDDYNIHLKNKSTGKWENIVDPNKLGMHIIKIPYD